MCKKDKAKHFPNIWAQETQEGRRLTTLFPVKKSGFFEAFPFFCFRHTDDGDT